MTHLTPYARRKRRLRRVALLLLLLGVFVLLLPTILAVTGQLRQIVERGLRKQGLMASVADCRVGWFTPLRIEELKIEGPEGVWRADLPLLVGTAKLWQLLTSADLGEFIVEAPVVTLRSTDFKAESLSPKPRKKRLRVLVRQLKLTVQPGDLSSSVTVAEKIDLDADWNATGEGRLLTLQSGRPLDELELTTELCNLGLKYVAPVFAHATWTSGRISLKLDVCQIALDKPRESVVNGTLTLHKVEAGLRPQAGKIVANVVQVFREIELPESIRITEEADVEFDIQNGLVHHTGFEFGLPELAPKVFVHTRGSVSFDQELDILAAVPIPFGLPGSAKLATALKDGTIEIPIGGTLEEPKIEMEMNSVVEKIASIVAGEQLDLDAADVANVLRALRDRVRQRRRDRRPLAPQLFRNRNRPRSEP